MSRSLIRGKIHSCLCYDERRENSPIIKIIDEFDMKKNNLVKSICNGVFKIAYCIWFFKMFYVISPIFTIITYFACAHFTISPQILHNETTIFVIKLHKKRTQTRSFTVVAREGFEPTTPRVWTVCSSQLSYLAIYYIVCKPHTLGLNVLSGTYRARTCDPLLVRQMLSQLS